MEKKTQSDGAESKQNHIHSKLSLFIFQSFTKCQNTHFFSLFVVQYHYVLLRRGSEFVSGDVASRAATLKYRIMLTRSRYVLLLSSETCGSLSSAAFL